jgi:MerR family transcriptional regulator, light-induced transcriptional regulator
MPDSTAPLVGISAVERDTGLSKDTLRVWERRYGFPKPSRDAQGERAYTQRDVFRLRLVRRLLDAGHRPGRLLGLDEAQLQALDSPAAPAGAVADGPDGKLDRLMELIRDHDLPALRDGLSQLLLRIGLEPFVLQVAAPMNRRVGQEWASGRLAVHEEHLYTEVIQRVLRNAIADIPAGRQPTVLLTTLPHEPHGLGLLMAESVLALDGCQCVALGVQTPVPDIVESVRRLQADIVALSFTGVGSAQTVLEGLGELRARLPASVQIWAGGDCPVLGRRRPAGITVLTDLPQLHTEVSRWRRLPPEGNLPQSR